MSTRFGPLGFTLLTLLGVMLWQAPASAQAQTAAPNTAAPCQDSPAESREACSGEPLDYRQAATTDLQTVSLLPAGRLGERYRPSRVIYGGTPGYAIDAKSIVPAGMDVTPSGFLEGTPAKAGPNVLMLIIRDSSQPANVVHGSYILNVLEPRRATKVTRPPPLEDATAPPEGR